MDVSGINQSYLGAQAFKNTNGVKAATTVASPTTPQSDDAALQELIDYFFESPAQRIVDNWLKAHGITKEQFDAMSPEQQEALRRQMAEDIRDKCEKRAEERSKTGLDILV
ncbi:MAG: hypothetical protein WC521_00325 [Bdellovibrionales bacterium]|jgi:DNA repair photolyase